MRCKFILSISLMLLSTSVWATGSAQWIALDSKSAKPAALSTQALYSVDSNALLTDMRRTQRIALPTPDGQVVNFSMQPASVMHPELAAKFPQIQAFVGKNDDGLSARVTFTPTGFSALFTTRVDDANSRVFIDSVQEDVYRSYKVSAEELHVARTGHVKHAPKLIAQRASRANYDDVHHHNNTTNASFSDTLEPIRLARTAGQITRYRLTVSAAGEYTQYHYDRYLNTEPQGTETPVAVAMGEIVAMVNRLNEIFTVEVASEFQLVANNDLLVFTDPVTDPFNNDSDDGTLNRDVTDDAIGVENYDIGHIINTDGGGLAVLGALCSRAFKADGVSGLNNPTNDAFWVDIVAHELGHQFGARHTYNGQDGFCGDNRSPNAAFEPGAGTTIMSYSGLCDSQNVTPQVHDNFHHHSLNEMYEHFADVEANDFGFYLDSCGTDLSGSNTSPTVEAGDDFTIPANTYFDLLGSGSDADGDELTYSWEQADVGGTQFATANASAMRVDQGGGPILRAFSPRTSPNRNIPQVNDQRSGNLTLGETLPGSNREVNFVLTARDGNGGIAQDEMQVTVVDTGEAFTITTPLSGQTFTSNPITIEYNVAGTNTAPINCSTVDVMLSNNGGRGFTQTLATGVANDGSVEVNLPATTGEQGFQVIKVQCAGNIFYATHSGVFSSNIDGPTLAITGQSTLITDEETPLTLSVSDFTYSLNAQSITVLAGTNYTVNGNTITPATNFAGNLQVAVQANAGNLSSSTFNALITVNNVNDTPVANDDTASVSQDSTAVSINVLGNDSDADSNDTLTITNVSTDASGSVNIVSNAISYTPASGFVGTETITYTVSDGADTDTATVAVTVTEVVAPISISAQSALVIDEDTSLTLSLAQFTTSAQADSLTVLPGSNYSVSGTTITPNANFNGSLSVTVQPVLAGAESVDFTASVTVNPVNDAPTVNNVTRSINTNDNTSINVLSNANDIDNDTLTITSVTSSQNATVQITANNSIDYTAPATAGTDTLTYTVSDGTTSVEGTVTITINAPAQVTPPPISSGGSSGGSVSAYWLLLLAAILMRRTRIRSFNIK